jgi:hypothetical protein
VYCHVCTVVVGVTVCLNVCAVCVATVVVGGTHLLKLGHLVGLAFLTSEALVLQPHKLNLKAGEGKKRHGGLKARTMTLDMEVERQGR